MPTKLWLIGLGIGTVVCAVFAGMVTAHDEELGEGKSNLAGGGGGSPLGTIFSSFKIDQLSRIPKVDLLDPNAPAAERGSDIWGWTDSVTGVEYALVGLSDGTAFVDISDPVNPVNLGRLPTHTFSSAWRDIKTYNDHAYIVSDNGGLHGMQIFDLTKLRGLSGPPVQFAEDGHYSGFSRAHNLNINETTGYLYAVGTNQDSDGLHILDLSNPTSPVKVGAYSADGYTHDVQVVNYNGPDAAHQGKEIAFAFNVDTLTIVDVTSKTTPVQLSSTGYSASGYVHQGWLTEDHAYLLHDDELDERNNPAINFTRTHVWDMADIDNPVYIGFHEHTVGSVDHNLYTHNNLAFQANYTTGLRVLDLTDIASSTADSNGHIDEINTVAWIDTHPGTDSLTAFDGAWSVYPYFSSGAIVIGDRDEGLVVVQLNILDGDTESDHDVDLTNLQVVAANWMTTVDAGFMEGDFDLNDVVNQLDLDLMRPNWLMGTGEFTPTWWEALQSVGLPEPGTVWVVAVWVVSAMCRRRRQA